MDGIYATPENGNDTRCESSNKSITTNDCLLIEKETENKNSLNVDDFIEDTSDVTVNELRGYYIFGFAVG